MGHERREEMPEKTVRQNITIPESVRDQMREEALKQGRSLSNMISRVLATWLVEAKTGPP